MTSGGEKRERESVGKNSLLLEWEKILGSHFPQWPRIDEGRDESIAVTLEGNCGNGDI
jgi:hypothetical protein